MQIKILFLILFSFFIFNHAYGANCQSAKFRYYHNKNKKVLFLEACQNKDIFFSKSCLKKKCKLVKKISKSNFKLNTHSNPSASMCLEANGLSVVGDLIYNKKIIRMSVCFDKKMQDFVNDSYLFRYGIKKEQVLNKKASLKKLK